MTDFNREAATALAPLVDRVLSEPSLRQAFRKDPQRTASDAGIDISAIPQRVIQTLAGLSVAELRMLSELNAVFVKEGLFCGDAREADGEGYSTMMVF
jgi:hypothetical protein